MDDVDMSTCQGIDVYRVGKERGWQRALRSAVAMRIEGGRPTPRLLVRAVLACRSVTWRRTWQAEWEGCERAVRGWTRRGTERKARRVRLWTIAALWPD